MSLSRNRLSPSMRYGFEKRRACLNSFSMILSIMLPASAGHRPPPRTVSSTNPEPREPVESATQQRVGQNGEDGCDGQRLERVDPAKHDDLIDQVQNHREHENLADGLPPFGKQGAPGFGMGEYRPQVRRPARFRVLHAITQREQRGHDRLQIYPKGERTSQPPDEIRPVPCKDVVHLCSARRDGPHDTAETEVTRRRIDRLGESRGRPIPLAIVRRTQMRASFDHLPWNAYLGLAGVVAFVLLTAARVPRRAARFEDFVGMLRIVPVGGPLPDVPDHVVEPVAVGWEGIDG